MSASQIEHVAAPGLVGDFQRAFGQLGQALFFPCFARPFPRFQTAFHVIQQRHGDKAFGGFQLSTACVSEGSNSSAASPSTPLFSFTATSAPAG